MLKLGIYARGLGAQQGISKNLTRIPGLVHKRSSVVVVCGLGCGVRSRGSTGRTASNPLGWQHYESVAAQNVLVARTLLILLFCQSKRIWWVLEQPVGSLMERHPAFQRFLKLQGTKVHRLTTSMLWFGGETKKPTWLYSSALGFKVGLQNFFTTCPPKAMPRLIGLTRTLPTRR